MLYFLTGHIQTGKTRWLLRLAEELEADDVEVCGVVAPGVWNPVEGGFEKLGIDNLLLPERRIVKLARGSEQSSGEPGGESSQARQAGVHWAIRDDAIAELNAHFDRLRAIEKPGNRVLVVDELGPLELVHGGGLVSAMALLERGATHAFPHAIAVVRDSLIEVAHERFAEAPWGGMQDISPSIVLPSSH